MIDNKKILKEDNIKRLDEISKYERNWDGFYDLSPFEKNVVDVCKKIVEKVEIQPNIETRFDGAIQLEWNRRIQRQLFVLVYEDYVEIQIRCDNRRIGTYGSTGWELRLEDKREELDEDWLEITKVKFARDWEEIVEIIDGYYKEFWDEDRFEDWLRDYLDSKEWGLESLDKNRWFVFMGVVYGIEKKEDNGKD